MGLDLNLLLTAVFSSAPIWLSGDICWVMMPETKQRENFSEKINENIVHVKKRCFFLEPDIVLAVLLVIFLEDNYLLKEISGKAKQRSA